MNSPLAQRILRSERLWGSELNGGNRRKRLPREASMSFVALNGVSRKCRAAQNAVLDSLSEVELYLPQPRIRRSRRISRAATKVAYIGHSYHEKTKSSAFFLDYLRRHFDVEVILDAEWSGVPLQDLSFLDESYVGVIFFQSQPLRERVDQIRNDNVIFVPMYDSDAWRGYRYWRQFRGLKVISFSSTLYERLIRWGFQTLHVQYFPEPLEFAYGNSNEVFFWQRVTKINTPLVTRLFAGGNVSLHVHEALDPHQTLSKVVTEDELGYGITYSKWFETREEMLEVVRDKALYVAPREREGIGMSFLEAMAMGKAVVAVDNPTMNEYIEHGRTGYLFDLRRPERLDLANVRAVQRNAYARICAGHGEWERSKHRIVEFMYAP